MAILGDLAEIVMGQSPPGRTVIDWDGAADFQDGLPFIQGNAEFGSDHPEPRRWCNKPLKVAEHGDTLISVRAPVGETNRANCRMAIGRGLAAIRFSSADPNYGWHIVNHAKSKFLRVAQGSTFHAVGRDEVQGLGVALPPVAEQRAIAAVLDAIDEAIERTEAVISATERLRDALLHEVLTRGIPGWHTKWRLVPGLGTVPADWKVVRLKEMCERITKGTTPTTVGHEYAPSGVRFLRVENIAEGLVVGGELRFITRETHQMLSRSVLQDGDILLSIAGALGRSALITSDNLPANVNQALAIIRLAKKQRATPEFIVLVLRGNMVQKQVYDLRAELAQANINLEQVGSLTIALPSLAEQQAIVKIVDGASAAIEMAYKGRSSVHIVESVYGGCSVDWILTDSDSDKGRSMTDSKDTASSARRGRGPSKTYPTSTFEDALSVAGTIATHGSSDRMRRLTLFDRMGRAAESRQSRELVTSSGRYGLTSGSYQAEFLELTPEGKSVVEESSSRHADLRVKFELAVVLIEPFNQLYDRLKNQRVPADDVLTDELALVQIPEQYRVEAGRVFMANMRYLGLIQEVRGNERLISIDDALEDVPDGEMSQLSGDGEPSRDSPQQDNDLPNVTSKVRVATADPSVHIDVQIHIDSSATAEQIDQIFRSMARHLYARGG